MPRYDAFGFELPPELTEAQLAAREACQAASRRRESKPEWVMVDRDRTLPGHAELKKLARKGIPPRLRPWVWSAASGALARRAEHGRDYYPAMVMMGEGEAQAATTTNSGSSPPRTSSSSSPSAVGRQVDLDLPRTFPGNPRVEACLPALRRVLLAFAAHAPQVGYCQSMNFVAAFLLVAAVVADDKSFDDKDDDSWFSYAPSSSTASAAREGSRAARPHHLPAIAALGRGGRNSDSKSSGPSSSSPPSLPPRPRPPTAREEETAFWLLVSLADDSEASVVATMVDSPPPVSAAEAAANGRARGKGRGAFILGGGGNKKTNVVFDSSVTSSPSRSSSPPPSTAPPLPPPILPPGMYGRDLLGCRVELKALAEGVRSRSPKLARHVLDDLACDASLLATDWFLCLFATTLPSETVARVWDSLFVEGNKVLHRVALALVLKRHATAMMTARNAGAAMRAAREGAAGEHDADGLMRTCFEGLGSVPMSKIDAARKEARREVEAEVWGRREARRVAAEARLNRRG